MRTLRYFAAGAALLLASCASTGTMTGGSGGNYAANSALAAEMSGRDEAALARVFVPAVESGAAGQSAVWSSGNFAGAVTPGSHLVANLLPDPDTMLPLSADLALNESFETELGTYALTRTANLRAGPSTDAAVLTKLEAGTAVNAIGKVSGKPWYLVATGGKVRGYVHESLVVRAPNDDLLLAGGPTRRARECRAFEQRLTVFGRTDRWSGVACKDGGAWRVETTTNAPVTG